MKKLLLTNLAYGQKYADLFLNQHLKSLLDESNIPTVRKQLEYILFTDTTTAPHIAQHPNFQLLQSLVPVEVVTFTLAPGIEGYQYRYQLLVEVFRKSVSAALERDSLCSLQMADLVVAKGWLPQMLVKFEHGYKSIFCLCMRTAAESIIPLLNEGSGALPKERLFELAYNNLHPLWLACHWESPTFSKMPFSLIWNTTVGLLVRSFSVTPIMFVPNPAMLNVRSSLDVEVPSFCENPFWALDWLDCPIIGVEPLHCFYPPFSNEPSNVDKLRVWSKASLHPTQLVFLKHQFCFPNRAALGASPKFLESDKIVQDYLRGL